MGWSRVLLPAPEGVLLLEKSSSPRSCFHELLPGEAAGFLSISYRRPIWAGSNSGNRRSRLSACRQRRGRGRQSRWEKISPAGRNRRCLNKCYGHLSSPRERRLFCRYNSSSDWFLPCPCGFCSLDTRVVSAWRKADRKRCPGPDFPSFNHQSPGEGEGVSAQDLPAEPCLSGYHPEVPQGGGSCSFGASPSFGEELSLRSFAFSVSSFSLAFDFFLPGVHSRPSRPIFDI